MVTILSIDGGGIRGIIPAAILAEIEKRTGKHICELFDYIAGTSTGGIIAAMLTVPNHKGKPKYTAEQIKSLYINLGYSVFNRSLIRKIFTLNGIISTRYSARKLEKYLNEYLGDTRLHLSLSDLIVPAYETESCSPWFFKTTHAKRTDNFIDNPYLFQVARGTSAAPSLFPPLKIGDNHCFIDGGVVANNPALCAYSEAKKLYPNENAFLVVSLGTGRRLKFHKYNNIKNWGALNWAIPILNVLSNSSSATVDYQMKALLRNGFYHRFELILDSKTEKMDNASKRNIQHLEAIARKEVMKNSAKIDDICRMLS